MRCPHHPLGLQLRPRVARPVTARGIRLRGECSRRRLRVGTELPGLRRGAVWPRPPEVVGGLEPDGRGRRRDEARGAGSLRGFEHVLRSLDIDFLVFREENRVAVARADERRTVEDRQWQGSHGLWPWCFKCFGDCVRVGDVGGDEPDVLVLRDFLPRWAAEVDDPDRLRALAPHQQVLHDPASHEPCRWKIAMRQRSSRAI